MISLFFYSQPSDLNFNIKLFFYEESFKIDLSAIYTLRAITLTHML